MPPVAAESSLEELARKAAGGDRGALRAIYERTAEPLVREVIGPIVVQRAACEDVLRETFLVALERPSALAAGRVFPWLATIARNKALDRRRRLATEGRFQSLLVSELALAEAALPNPESEVVHAEARALTRAEVNAVLEQMNPRYAAALRARLLEELSRERCAAQFEVTVGTFDVLFFRACRQFRQLYEERAGGAT